MERLIFSLLVGAAAGLVVAIVKKSDRQTTLFTILIGVTGGALGTWLFGL